MFEVLRECFAINLNDYENINFSLEINKVVLGVSIALVLGIIFLSLYRGNIRLVVMQLTRHGAQSEESAKKLSELGLEKSVFVKYLLSGNNALTKVVARVGEKKYSYEDYVALSKEERKESEKINFENAAFYIKEEEKNLVMTIMEKYSASVTRTALASVFVVIICVCVIACMPGILNVINKTLGSIKM